MEDGQAVAKARSLAATCLKQPETARRNSRIHFVQPLKQRIVREVGYGLALEGASAAALVQPMKARAAQHELHSQFQSRTIDRYGSIANKGEFL